ncbi:hypothetical protein MAPG_09967 [Magnaporthiopsis poae ATCC 64411]|uniref:Uncharacterized protein n=1 Tax=Magnaporthiopsis poae (strain ATCC 64411 / 73-15) TaxID=644358 RepID=A0A0C4EBB9_MAGP6|nr:hypothetical protein MAPG_09967 [Magnaporthiopsis poae ATCC 64411]
MYRPRPSPAPRRPTSTSVASAMDPVYYEVQREPEPGPVGPQGLALFALFVLVYMPVDYAELQMLSPARTSKVRDVWAPMSHKPFSSALGDGDPIMDPFRGSEVDSNGSHTGYHHAKHGGEGRADLGDARIMLCGWPGLNPEGKPLSIIIRSQPSRSPRHSRHLAAPNRRPGIVSDSLTTSLLKVVCGQSQEDFPSTIASIGEGRTPDAVQTAHKEFLHRKNSSSHGCGGPKRIRHRGAGDVLGRPVPDGENGLAVPRAKRQMLEALFEDNMLGEFYLVKLNWPCTERGVRWLAACEPSRTDFPVDILEAGAGIVGAPRRHPSSGRRTRTGSGPICSLAVTLGTGDRSHLAETCGPATKFAGKTAPEQPSAVYYVPLRVLEIKCEQTATTGLFCGSGRKP